MTAQELFEATMAKKKRRRCAVCGGDRPVTDGMKVEGHPEDHPICPECDRQGWR